MSSECFLFGAEYFTFFDHALLFGFTAAEFGDQFLVLFQSFLGLQCNALFIILALVSELLHDDTHNLPVEYICYRLVCDIESQLQTSCLHGQLLDEIFESPGL